MTLLAPSMQAWFTDRLINQRDASSRTITAYRDTMRLLLTFASEHTRKLPSRLDIDDLDAPMIGAFLDHLEQDRGNSPRTRNARLAAIHSLYRYCALRHPEHAWFASESTPQIGVLITQHLRGFRHYTEGVFDDRAGTFSRQRWRRPSTQAVSVAFAEV
jgi:integrase